MALTPRTITLPFAFSEGTEILAAPADLVVPGNWNVDGAWKICNQCNEEVMGSGSTRDVGAGQFNLNDNVLIEAFRINCPFGDALVVTQPRIEFRIFGFHGATPILDVGLFGEPHLFVDYAAPWGEWQELNRFVPKWIEVDDPGSYVYKYLGIKTYPVTLRTNILDPTFNGLPVKMEIELKVRHTYAQVG
jgi:hypothetical protein